MKITSISSLLEKHLNSDVCKIYFVLDGARINNLFDKIYPNEEIKFEYLGLGEREPDIAEVSPYLIEFELESEFAQWLYSGWGESWGVYLLSKESIDIRAMRRALKSLSIVYDPNNEPLFFRWYDPRVFRTVMPVMDSEQLDDVFNCVHKFIVEDMDKTTAKVFSNHNGKLSTQAINLKE